MEKLKVRITEPVEELSEPAGQQVEKISTII